jgi:hypothetical protein
LPYEPLARLVRASTPARRAVVCVLLIVGFAGACRTPRTSETVTPPRASPVEGTQFEVRDRGFRIALPSGWTRAPVSPDGPEVFRSPDDSEHLTVTSLSSDTPISEAKRTETLRALVENRQKAERQGMGSSMTAREPVISTAGRISVARYDGLDAAADHRFATMVLVSERGAWVAFLESPASIPEEPFRKHAATILDGLSVLQ